MHGAALKKGTGYRTSRNVTVDVWGWKCDGDRRYVKPAFITFELQTACQTGCQHGFEMNICIW